MKNIRINIIGIIFSICFLLVTIFRWNNIEMMDRIFYCLAVVGLGLIGIAPLFNKRNHYE